MSKIVKINNVKFAVEFNVKPHSSKDMLDKDNERMKGLPVKSTFDFSKINTQNVDVPKTIMDLAIADEIISYQETLRKLVPAKDFEGLEKAIEKRDKIHIVGIKADRVIIKDPFIVLQDDVKAGKITKKEIQTKVNAMFDAK